MTKDITQPEVLAPEKKNHARYSPSKLDDLSRCIRFKYKETPKDDEDDSSDAASEGTLMHKAAETGNLAGLSQEQALQVTKALEYVDGLKASDEFSEDLSEVPLRLEGLTYGTADRVLISKNAPRYAHVVDYKFGRLDGEHAYQVRTYGAALLEANPTVERVLLHVVAPRVGDPEPPIEAGRELVGQVRGELEALYARIDDPWEPATPDAELCSRCARASRCPAFNSNVVAVARNIGLPMPSTFSPGNLVTPVDRAIAQTIARALMAWGEQVIDRNNDYVAQGGAMLPGYKEVSRSTGFSIPVDNRISAYNALQASGWQLDDLLANSKLSIGKLAAMLAERDGLDEGEVKGDLLAALGELATEGRTRYLQKVKKCSDVDLLSRLVLEQ
jgi:hypothetical protein